MFAGGFTLAGEESPVGRHQISHQFASKEKLRS